jgi:hypothetical protein
MNTTVVTSHEHEDEYWTLAVFKTGTRIDRFASWPTYFATRAAEGRRPERLNRYVDVLRVDDDFLDKLPATAL